MKTPEQIEQNPIAKAGTDRTEPDREKSGWFSGFGRVDFVVMGSSWFDQLKIGLWRNTILQVYHHCDSLD